MRHAPFLVVGIISTISLAFANDTSSGRKADQAALKVYGELVGDWRGTGQVKRNTSKGSWTERSSWAWKLTNETAALEFKAKDGKYLKSALLRPGKKPGEFSFDAMLADDTKRSFFGKSGKDDVLTLTANGESDGLHRVTITPLHGTRVLLLLESKDDSGGYQRLGEVGYTREGIAFAAGESYPLCIVTEGRGTISVIHKGKTYYVCCSGCKDLFNENPEAIIAEAEAKAKAKDKGK
jgi:YHS domain-containing protein